MLSNVEPRRSATDDAVDCFSGEIIPRTCHGGELSGMALSVGNQAS